MRFLYLLNKQTRQNMPYPTLFICLIFLTLSACKQQPADNHSESAAPTANTATGQNEAAAGTEAAPETTHNADAAFDLMNNESLGNLKLGLPQTEVLSQLGKPDEKSKATVWEADGLTHQEWSYKAKGIILDMSGQSENNFTIGSITITPPSSLKTKTNVGIGSTLDEVTNAYKAYIDPSLSDTAYVVAGSVYGGLVFTFTRKKVSSVFIGAAAE